MRRYRMMFLFKFIRDIPKEVDPKKSSSNYYIEYQMFTFKKVRYKLDLT